jgi:uncharacterized protein (TIGR00290 family)
MKAWVSWSSGKDSALALHLALGEADLEVVGLLTTLNAEADRVAMHAVRRVLLAAQAEATGLPVHVVELPSPCPNSIYEEKMSAVVSAAAESGIERIIFGDIFLADIRAYREAMLEGSGVAPLFPLWGEPTRKLSREVLDLGFRAVITCVDPRQAPAEIAGRRYDLDLLRDLPEGVDPCGENGEFHTFVSDGPDFAHPLAVSVGEVVERDGFVFADVVPT